MSGSGVLSSSWVSPDSRAESLPAVRQKFHLTHCAKIRDHLSCRSLIFERLLQLALACLLCLEQPRVLDGDHRLVGKRGDQLNFFVGERLNNSANERYHTKWFAVAQLWNAKHAAIFANPLILLERILRISQTIRNMNSLAFERGAADQ